MASTVMVPIGNLAFALPFIPGSAPLRDSDIASLIVILVGLVAYPFGDALGCRMIGRWRNVPPLPWRRGKTRYRTEPGLDGEQFEWDEPIYTDENEGVVGGGRGLRTPRPLLEQPLLTSVQ